MRDRIAIHSEEYYCGLLGTAPNLVGAANLTAPSQKYSHLNGNKEANNKLWYIPDRKPAPQPEFFLYMAEHEGEELAGIIVSHCGARATYMYGASTSRKRELMPNHLLQWRAIADARDSGAVEYDFFGIPPRGEKSHALYGLWRFKTGFGGEIHHYYGAWDYPYRKGLYSVFSISEKIHRFWVNQRKRR